MSELDIAVQNCKVALVRYKLCTSGRTVHDDMEERKKKAWKLMQHKHSITNLEIRY